MKTKYSILLTYEEESLDYSDLEPNEEMIKKWMNNCILPKKIGLLCIEVRKWSNNSNTTIRHTEFPENEMEKSNV